MRIYALLIIATMYSFGSLAASPDLVDTAEEAIHKIDFLVNRGKIPETYNTHLQDLMIETVSDYEARVPIADRVSIPKSASTIVTATQYIGSGQTDRPIIHLFYKSNGKYLRKKEILVNEDANDSLAIIWPNSVTARDLLESGLHFFTEDAANKQAFPKFSKSFSKVTVEKPSNGNVAIVKLYSSIDTTQFLRIETDMGLNIVKSEWVTIP